MGAAFRRSTIHDRDTVNNSPVRVQAEFGYVAYPHPSRRRRAKDLGSIRIPHHVRRRTRMPLASTLSPSDAVDGERPGQHVYREPGAVVLLFRKAVQKDKKLMNQVSLALCRLRQIVWGSKDAAEAEEARGALGHAALKVDKNLVGSRHLPSALDRAYSLFDNLHAVEALLESRQKVGES